MDEPLSNLDAKLRTVMRAELKHLQRELETTTIYVTHDQVEAMTLADRIVILNDARIQQIGTPAEIYAKPANDFVASFIGSPPMNLIEGEIRGGVFTHSGGTVPCEGEADGAVKLGIRPEDIMIATGEDQHLTGRVYSSELLGDSTLLNLRSGDKLIVMKAGPEEGREMDSTLSLQFDLAKIAFFDRTTGERR